MRVLTLTSILAFSLTAGVVIDRITVVVNRHPLKASDIDRDIRITAFLNKEQPKFDADSKKKATERLIDQEIIRAQIETGAYRRATDAEAAALLTQLRRERAGDSDARLRQDLSRYGVTEDQLKAQLLWQLTVLRFIDERFRASVLVTDEDVQKYYTEHRTSYRNPLEKESPGIRNTLEGEQVNQQFEAWLAQARQRAQIEYHEEALR